MKFMDGVKLAIGFEIGRMIFGVACNVGARHIANNDKYMNDLKFRDPDRYERLLKYRRS